MTEKRLSPGLLLLMLALSPIYIPVAAVLFIAGALWWFVVQIFRR